MRRATANKKIGFTSVSSDAEQHPKFVHSSNRHEREGRGGRDRHTIRAFHAIICKITGAGSFPLFVRATLDVNRSPVIVRASFFIAAYSALLKYVMFL
ncbi:hypothetical protein BCR43DRAFT_497810 [Syncephalastrum racemosum]|uniref:Uncharacterized protein n=1 Tax=Syncephalastrum racemosum TaxID=13706 RepID=A0A1X2H2V9_SYNRA|nr:hypothetical protein BCR43DRAFT_497810 [Syncephalastrum racemosum]